MKFWFIPWGHRYDGNQTPQNSHTHVSHVSKDRKPGNGNRITTRGKLTGHRQRTRRRRVADNVLTQAHVSPHNHNTYKTKYVSKQHFLFFSLLLLFPFLNAASDDFREPRLKVNIKVI